jgi:site-specific DNA recombinase
MARILVAARLSRGGNDGPSRLERDDEEAREWAERNGHEIVETTRDADTSGSTDPFDPKKRKQLAPWLKDPALLAKYDTLVASKLDRLGRSARHIHRLQEWADKHGKQIVVLGPPPLVWPVPKDDIGSQFMWPLLATLAEWERDAITDRIVAAHRTIDKNKAFRGKPPFGFEIVGDERYNKQLRPRDDLAPVLREMVDRALRGDTYTSIAEWLDESEVSTVHGKPWSQTSVRTVLANPALKGRILNKDKEVTYKFDGPMNAAEWDRLQASLDRRPQRRGMITADTALLTSVIFCDRCGGPMYRTKSKRAKEDGTVDTWFYYRCGGLDRKRSVCKNMVRVEDVDAWVDSWFTEEGTFARTEIVETITIPGNDHADEIAENSQEIRELDPDAQNYDEQLTRLRAERARLQSLPSEPAQVTEQPTGKTVGDLWASLDDQERRRFLLAAGMKVHCMSNKTLRAQEDGYRQNPTGPAIMLRQRMGPMPRPGQSSATTTPTVLDIAPDQVPATVPAWGTAEPVERERIYITGDPTRIEGALANLTAPDTAES